ncbi:head-tail connector protein [Denitromonas halophila]|uniref:Phage gp6-like head-tail connector protein n=1 Tax=Denitromonas halophila TaxID=1629404 RepID=A0A557QJT7_9RHOO|nr:head-tail connector protein [Denitromonas halophila]TVO53164.1 phage gp6-like head-tail connector protein [Denitromonas halophila]
MIAISQAKMYLRIDDDHEDDLIHTLINMAEGIVRDYVMDFADGVAWRNPSADGANVMDAAALLILGELYQNRNSAAAPLSPTVRIILERLRSPALA